jgi:hypothetical protein
MRLLNPVSLMNNVGYSNFLRGNDIISSYSVKSGIKDSSPMRRKFDVILPIPLDSLRFVSVLEPQSTVVVRGPREA